MKTVIQFLAASSIALAAAGCGAADLGGELAVGKTEAALSSCQDFNWHQNQCRSQSDWQQQAEHQCEQSGKHILGFHGSNSCGHDSFHEVQFQCCDNIEPPPSGGSCNWFNSNQNQCFGEDHLKSWAEEECQGRHSSLGQFHFFNQCGNGSFHGVQYQCCDSWTPPPPPSGGSCNWFTSNQNQCFGDDQWKSWAGNQCEQSGSSLGQFSFMNECGQGSSHGMRYQCCETPIVCSGGSCTPYNGPNGGPNGGP